jgi:hypothetical protein
LAPFLTQSLKALVSSEPSETVNRRLQVVDCRELDIRELLIRETISRRPDGFQIRCKNRKFGDKLIVLFDSFLFRETPISLDPSLILGNRVSDRLDVACPGAIIARVENLFVFFQSITIGSELFENLLSNMVEIFIERVFGPNNLIAVGVDIVVQFLEFGAQLLVPFLEDRLNSIEIGF